MPLLQCTPACVPGEDAQHCTRLPACTGAQPFSPWRRKSNLEASSLIASKHFFPSCLQYLHTMQIGRARSPCLAGTSCRKHEHSSTRAADDDDVIGSTYLGPFFSLRQGLWRSFVHINPAWTAGIKNHADTNTGIMCRSVGEREKCKLVHVMPAKGALAKSKKKNKGNHVGRRRRRRETPWKISSTKRYQHLQKTRGSENTQGSQN